MQPGHCQQAAKAPNPQFKRDFQAIQIVREPVFWVMYLMFVLRRSRGMLAVAQLKGWGSRRNPSQHPRPHASRTDCVALTIDGV